MKNSKSYNSPLFSLNRTGSVGLIVPWKCHAGHPVVTVVDQCPEIFQAASDLDSINYEWHYNGEDLSITPIGLRVPSDLNAEVADGDLGNFSEGTALWMEKMCPTSQSKNESSWLNGFTDDNLSTWNAALCSYFGTEGESACMEYGRLSISSDLFVELFVRYNKAHLDLLLQRLQQSIAFNIEFNQAFNDFVGQRGDGSMPPEACRYRFVFDDNDRNLVQTFLSPEFLDDRWRPLNEKFQIRVPLYLAHSGGAPASFDLPKSFEFLGFEKSFFHSYLQNFTFTHCFLEMDLNNQFFAPLYMADTLLLAEELVTRDTLFMCPGQLLRCISLKALILHSAPFIGTKWDVDEFCSVQYDGKPAKYYYYPKGASFPCGVFVNPCDGSPVSSALSFLTNYFDDRGGLSLWLNEDNEYPDCYCGVGDLVRHLSVCPSGKFALEPLVLQELL